MLLGDIISGLVIAWLVYVYKEGLRKLAQSLMEIADHVRDHVTREREVEEWLEHLDSEEEEEEASGENERMIIQEEEEV